MSRESPRGLHFEGANGDSDAAGPRNLLARKCTFCAGHNSAFFLHQVLVNPPPAAVDPLRQPQEGLFSQPPGGVNPPRGRAGHLRGQSAFVVRARPGPCREAIFYRFLPPRNQFLQDLGFDGFEDFARPRSRFSRSFEENVENSRIYKKF